MADELRKSYEKFEKVLENLVYLVSSSNREDNEDAQKWYREALDIVSQYGDTKTENILKDITNDVGSNTRAPSVIKAATHALKSYSDYVDKKIKKLERKQKRKQAELEKAKKKFEKVRAKLKK